MLPINFSQSPFIVIWETTRSCGLKCLHCRAEAIERNDPCELSLEQSFRLMDQIASFNNSIKVSPLVVLTGGDPMRYPHIFEIVRYGVSLGLRMTMTPSATLSTTRKVIADLKKAGLARIAVSIDGWDASSHDTFRGVQGSFDYTMNMIRWSHQTRLPVQINSTITKYNYKNLDDLIEMLKEIDIVLWSVFFLVATGRGRLEDGISASQYEVVFEKMYQAGLSGGFDVKSTEAPHYRRFLLQRKKDEDCFPSECSNAPSFTDKVVARSRMGINAGKGFVFISHTGSIFPSGFLPLSAGNVKINSLVDVYRNAPLFQSLRDDSKLKGKCGACEYKKICGGSRSRAFAMFGDPLESEPFCSYNPKNYTPTQHEAQFSH